MPYDSQKKSHWFSLLQPERVKPSNLSDADVLSIRHRYKQGNVTQRELAAEYRISPGSIFDIISGRIRKDLNIGNVEIKQYPRGGTSARAKLTNADVLVIRSEVEKGIPQKDLSLQFGVSQCTVSSIVLRKTWKHI